MQNNMQKSPSLPMGHAVLSVIPSRCLKFEWRKNYWWRYLLFTSSYPNSTLWDLAVTLVTVTDTTQRRGCWSLLTAPCLGASLGVKEDWKCRQRARRKCGWRRGWKFTLMEIRVFRTSWAAPWIISYSWSQISIFKIQGYTRLADAREKTCPGWPTCSGKHTPPTLWKPCKRYVHSVMTCTLLLPSARILVDSLLKLKKSH